MRNGQITKQQKKENTGSIVLILDMIIIVYYFIVIIPITINKQDMDGTQFTQRRRL